ncbi:MAG TPA: universal stress protein [Acidimicrobiia bacterium]|nr:universal stress protein [Acidimicrobiia bacterium]
MSIVAAVDSSGATASVLARAIRQARQAGASLQVIHVYEPPTVTYSMAGIHELDDGRLAEAEAEAVWGGASPVLDDSGIDWVRHDARGYPPTAIADFAKEVDADLIVIGSRGKGAFLSLALGSTSHGVLHRAGCDVVVVRNHSGDI